MVSRHSSHSMTSCPPADRCSIWGLHFWWRDVKAISPKPTSELDDSPQHRNISCNAKEFNVQIERLMFCKAIRHNATPFVCTLCHWTLRWAIWRNTTPFVRRLCYSTLPWAIWRNATRDRCKGSHATLSLLIALNEFCDVCLSWRSTKGVEEGGNDVLINQFNFFLHELWAWSTVSHWPLFSFNFFFFTSSPVRLIFWIRSSTFSPFSHGKVSKKVRIIYILMLGLIYFHWSCEPKLAQSAVL